MTLRRARVRAKMTQAQVADFLGISAAAVSMWEHGKATPRPKNLVKLSALYNVTVDELLK